MSDIDVRALHNQLAAVADATRRMARLADDAVERSRSALSQVEIDPELTWSHAHVDVRGILTREGMSQKQADRVATQVVHLVLTAKEPT